MVRLRRSVVESAVAPGALGAIVVVHGAGEAYEFEFCDEHGATLDMLALVADDLEKVDESAPASR